MAMIGRLSTVVIDCQDVGTTAAFYAEMLGMEIVAEDPDWIDIGPPGAGWDGRVLSFQLSPEHVRPTWPDPTVPQQFHLDISVDDIEAAEADVLALGATRVPWHEEGFRVYTDPAGHTFCLTYGHPSA
ncbi:MAG: Glyoxalase-like domain protein [Actinotalea sp.]|nr:Glyoxalase-like domain protein [Actinotalea sp.]